tara:strand:- start:1285 stop:2514 length:1230 start_codon:yes stop_codon:yes gene_type:complete
MSNTLRYLHTSTTDATYESVHLFLFGISLDPELIIEKSWLESKLNSEKDVFKRITEDGNSESSLKQVLSIIRNDIERLEIKKEDFNISQGQEKDITELNELRYDIAKLSGTLGNLETKLKLINENLEELKQSKNSYDVNAIRDIYDEARLYIPDLQKRFEDVLVFHNSMIDNKIRFLSKDIPEVTENIVLNRRLLSTKVMREKELNLGLNKIFKISDYDELIKELNKKYELKGSKEERHSQVIVLNRSIEEKSERLKEINGKLEELEPNLEKNLQSFNLIFKSFSKKLYDEEFYASFDKINGNYKFSINNIDANVGGGKKKGQIAAFDLAYIKFCDENQIVAPKFVLHDSTEDVSINQLMVINDLANEIDGQYVVAVLRDKFSGDDAQVNIIEENKIIELSQDDKLFKF